MIRFVLGVALVMAGCAAPYAGPNCEAHAVGTATSTLPLNGTSEPSELIFRWSDPLIAGNDELRCCAQNSYAGKPDEATCAKVDCDAVRARVKVGRLEGRFENELCGPAGGASTCTAVIDEEKVVGVYAFCAD